MVTIAAARSATLGGAVVALATERGHVRVAKKVSYYFYSTHVCDIVSSSAVLSI